MDVWNPKIGIGLALLQIQLIQPTHVNLLDSVGCSTEFWSSNLLQMQDCFARRTFVAAKVQNHKLTHIHRPCYYNITTQMFSSPASEWKLMVHQFSAVRVCVRPYFILLSPDRCFGFTSQLSLTTQQTARQHKTQTHIVWTPLAEALI